MKRQLTIRHFLAALAWLGLTLAPLTASAAMAASMESTAVIVAAVPMDMPEAMPCCPDAQKQRDCGDCPFMALCAGMAFLPAAGVAIALPVGLLSVVAPRDDSGLAGLAHGPPARPPKA